MLLLFRRHVFNTSLVSQPARVLSCLVLSWLVLGSCILGVLFCFCIFPLGPLCDSFAHSTSGSHPKRSASAFSTANCHGIRPCQRTERVSGFLAVRWWISASTNPVPGSSQSWPVLACLTCQQRRLGPGCSGRVITPSALVERATPTCKAPPHWSNFSVHSTSSTINKSGLATLARSRHFSAILPCPAGLVLLLFRFVWIAQFLPTAAGPAFSRT